MENWGGEFSHVFRVALGGHSDRCTACCTGKLPGHLVRDISRLTLGIASVLYRTALHNTVTYSTT